MIKMISKLPNRMPVKPSVKPEMKELTAQFVGWPEIQLFDGGLDGQVAKKRFFITTSSFTREAAEFSLRNETKIVY